MSESKVCTRCSLVKPLTDYCRDRSKRDGLTSQCRACKTDLARAYRATDAGKASATAARKRFNEAHPERVRAASSAWWAKNPGYAAEHNRKRREMFPDEASNYYRANREAAFKRTARRRAAKREASVGVTDWTALWDSQGGRCGLCEEPIDRTLPYPDPLSASVDHIVPLSRGGAHEQANLQWTHLVCNLRKGTKLPTDTTLRRRVA